MNDVMRIASSILYACCIFLYTEKLLECKTKRSKLYITVIIIAGIFAVFASSEILLPIPLLYVGMYITLYLLFKIFFVGDHLTYAFATGNFIFHLLCIKGVLISFSSLLLKLSMFDIVSQSSTNDVVSTLLFIFASVFLWVFQRFYSIKDIEKMINNKKVIRQLIYIQFILDIMLLFTALIYYAKVSSPWLPIYHLLISSMLLIGFYFIFQFFSRNIKAKEHEEDIHNLKQQVEYEVKRYQSQMKYIQILRQIKHDYANQLTGMDHLLKTEGKEACARYVNDLRKEFRKTEHVYQKYSDHTLLDSILQEFAQSCQEKNIRFQALLKAENLGISDLNICTLFTNLLNNAFEANLKVPKRNHRFIDINSRESGGWEVITIRNRYDGILLEDNKGLRTTKDDVGEHGLGLKKAFEIVNTYGGMLRYDTDVKERVFLIQLMFPHI